MKKEETYRRLIGCPNCTDNQELTIPKGTAKKDYTIPPKTLCTNCGCRLDGKDTPEPETAIRLLVRQHLVRRNCAGATTKDWDWLVKTHPLTIKNYIAFSTDVLDLAIKELCETHNFVNSYVRRAIEPLKEKE